MSKENSFDVNCNQLSRKFFWHNQLERKFFLI